MVISFVEKSENVKNRFSIVDPQTVRDILLEIDGADIFTIGWLLSKKITWEFGKFKIMIAFT